MQSFSCIFYKTLAFKVRPKLSVSLPSLGLLLIQQALNREIDPKAVPNAILLRLRILLSNFVAVHR